MEDALSRQNTGLMPYLVATSQILGVAVLAITGTWLSHYRGGFSWEGQQQFNVHPLCMVLGMVFLCGDSLLVYRVFRHETKRATKILHGALHILALIISLVGIIAVFQYHKKNNIPDMYSMHSWLGITTFSFYILQVTPFEDSHVRILDREEDWYKRGVKEAIYVKMEKPSLNRGGGVRHLLSATYNAVLTPLSSQWIIGFIMFFLPGVAFAYKSRIKPLHVFFGIGLLMTTIATCLLGLTEKVLFSIPDQYSKMPSEGVLINALGLLLVAFGMVIAYILTREEWRRPPLPEEQALSIDFKTLTEGGESPTEP